MSKIIKSSNKKIRNCPICASENISDFSSGLSKVGKQKFLIETSVCQLCGFYFQNPILDYDKIEKIYANEYVGNDIKQEKRFNHEILKRKSSALSFIDLIKPNDSILEIGCSSGYNLKNIQDNFNGKLKLKGIDLDVNSIKFGAKKTGLDLSTEDAFALNEKFDFIFLNHVFEHVDSPKDFFGKLLPLLNERGYIILNVPNSKVWLESPTWEHISYFNVEAMRKMLLNFGTSENFVISSNIIHEKLQNIPEIRAIFSKNGNIPKRQSDGYKITPEWIRHHYDRADKTQRRLLAKKYKALTHKVGITQKLIWSKLYVFFTFKWIKY